MEIQGRYRGDTGEICLAAAPCVHEEDAPHHGEEGKVRHLAWDRVRDRHLAWARIRARHLARAKVRG